MPRYLIQSMNTGHFLVPSPEDGQPTWINSLRDAGGGVVDDMERVHQLFQDWCEFEDQAIVIDLDRLGTRTDYLPH
jgi:hypothetical protein